MKRVTLKAPALTQSGYGVHARQIARYLIDRHDRNEIELNILLVPWGTTPWYLNPDACGGLIGRIQRLSAPSQGPVDVSIQLQLPNEWDHNLARVNVGVTAGVETDRCNPLWIQAIERMSSVIVPSTFTKKCFEDTGPTTTKITVIPEAFNDVIVNNIDPLPIEFTTKFNILVFGQLTGNNKDNDRKNIFYTLKWLFDVFHDDPDVGIILKTNMGRATKIDRSIVHKMMQQLVHEVRKGDLPRLHVVHGDMSDQEVAGLLQHPTIKAFCLLSRGEGFCLPMLEAAATGLPIIAPAHSGYMDFMSNGKFIQIQHAQQRIHHTRVDQNIFMPDAMWAWPDEQDFKKKIKKFRNSPSKPVEWAKDHALRVRESHSYNAIARCYDEYFKEMI